MVEKGKKGETPDWKALLAAAAAGTSVEERLDVIKSFVSEINAVLEAHSTQPPGSTALANALGLNKLNSALSAIEPNDPSSYYQLVALNDVLAGADPRLAVILVEQQYFNPLVRVHERIGNAADRVCQAVVLVLSTSTLMASHNPSSLETIASKPALLQLIISQLIFLSLNPAVLLTPAGLGTAQRCIQVCWELTRAQAPHRSGFRELLVRIDMAGRLMALAAIATGRGPVAPPAPATDGDGAATPSGTASAESTVSGMAALDGKRTGPAATTTTTTTTAALTGAATGASGSDGDLLEERLALAAQAASLVVNLSGLGNRGIELSTQGLAPQRAWLLRPGTLAALRQPLEGLVDGLEALRRRIEERGHGAAEAAAVEPAAASLEGQDADLRPGRMPVRRLVDQVEGAVRNVLMQLGLPTIVMGTSEEDVVEACGFVIRHCYGLFTEGYMDTMKALRAAVADPPSPGAAAGRTAGGSAGEAAFTEPYPGDYGPFFRAFAGHIETIAPAIGVQLEDWGVRFTGEQVARDLPVMEVGEGVDARIAQSWLKGQIQDIINWGHTMMTLVRMADQAKMAAHQLAVQKAAGQQQQGAGGPQQGAGGAGVGAGGTAPVTAPCARCGAAPPAGGPPFMVCSRCKGVRYCSRACQVGHWAQHKPGCKPAAAPAAAAQGVAATSAAAAAAHPAQPAEAHPAVAAAAEAAAGPAGTATGAESPAEAGSGTTVAATAGMEAGEPVGTSSAAEDLEALETAWTAAAGAEVKDAQGNVTEETAAEAVSTGEPAEADPASGLTGPE